MTRGAPSGPRNFQPTRSPPRKPKYISVQSFSPHPSTLIRIHPGAAAASRTAASTQRGDERRATAARSFPARPHAGTAAHPDRRLRRQQVQPALMLHAQRVQPRVQVHHRRRVRHPLPPGRQQGCQGPDLGHRRPGTVRFVSARSSSPQPLPPPPTRQLVVDLICVSSRLLLECTSSFQPCKRGALRFGSRCRMELHATNQQAGIRL